MADPNDVAATKLLRREFARKPIDISQADLRVSHGVAYVRGVLKPMKGSAEPMQAMLDHISKALRSRGEFRDVVIDCVIRGEG
ncbi:MAG: hypothetical protein JNK63_04610 [Chthonomonas sp.]|nr:hypothetical protein [Chthonomonas sp.]